MNRAHRRALQRAKQTPLAGDLASAVKSTYKLPMQVCALWVPDAEGYIVHFSPQGFRVIEFAELARHYCEHDACSAALSFREIFGLRVVIRPVYPHQVVHDARAWSGSVGNEVPE